MQVDASGWPNETRSPKLASTCESVWPGLLLSRRTTMQFALNDDATGGDVPNTHMTEGISLSENMAVEVKVGESSKSPSIPRLSLSDFQSVGICSILVVIFHVYEVYAVFLMCGSLYLVVKAVKDMDDKSSEKLSVLCSAESDECEESSGLFGDKGKVYNGMQHQGFRFVDKYGFQTRNAELLTSDLEEWKASLVGLKASGISVKNWDANTTRISKMLRLMGDEYHTGKR